MQNNSNRLMAGFLLLAMFGVIALAGSRAAAKVQGTQNVLVTNTSAQQVPVLLPARPSAGAAYIVSVANTPGVKVSSTSTAPVFTKEVNNQDTAAGSTMTSAQMIVGAHAVEANAMTLSSTSPVIVDAVDVTSNSAQANEFADEMFVSVNGSGGLINACEYGMTPFTDSAFDSAYAGNPHLVVPAGGNLLFGVARHGGFTSITTATFNVFWHAVQSP